MRWAKRYIYSSACEDIRRSEDSGLKYTANLNASTLLSSEDFLYEPVNQLDL